MSIPIMDPMMTPAIAPVLNAAVLLVLGLYNELQKIRLLSVKYLKSSVLLVSSSLVTSTSSPDVIVSSVPCIVLHRLGQLNAV